MPTTSRLIAIFALLAFASPLTGCLVTDRDDETPIDEQQLDDRRFDAECKTVMGPVVFPNDLARVDNILGDAACARIDGNLTVRGDVTTLGKIEYLDELRVDGRVVVSNTTSWTDLKRLRAITEVGEDVVIEQCDGLESTAGMDRLRIVGGDFRVSQNPDLRMVEGPRRLWQIGSDLIIEENPVLCDVIGFDGLQYIAEYTSEEDRPEAAGAFGGTSPEFRRDGVIDPHIIITDNPQLRRIEGFGGLTDIDGDIRFERNDELSVVKGFEQLEFMTGKIIIRDQPFLQNIDAIVRMSCVREVILENTALTDLSAFDEVWEIGRLELVNNDGLAGVGGLREELRLRGPVIVQDNSSLRTLAGFGNIESLDMSRDFEREVNAIYRDTPNAFCVDTGLRDGESDLTIEGNPVLEELGMNNLRRMSGTLIVRDNDTLPDLSGLDGLWRVFGDVIIEDNDGMRAIAGLNPLERLAPGDIIISGNAALERLDGFGEINDIDGNMTIEANPALERIEAFRNLRELDALTIRDNAVVDLGGLTRVDELDALEVSNNPNLVALDDFASLRTVWKELRIENNASLQSIAMPALETVDGIVVRDNPNLSTCDLVELLGQLWTPEYIKFDGDLDTCT
jgi:hypothetical protein